MNHFTLYNGVTMPAIGFGTWKAPKDEITTQAVRIALTHGYTHIDAAAIYGNEHLVGEGIRQSKIKREDLFLTSKLWNTERGYEATMAAFEKTCSDLGVDYLDLYLIHWPRPSKYREDYLEQNIASWKAMEELYRAGKVRAIGISNFQVKHMEEFLPHCEIKPMVNQIEFHPSLLQSDIRAFCKEHNIVVQGYSPLANGRVFACVELKDLAAKLNIGVAQLCIQWCLQHDVVALVKSVTEERIISNLKLDVTLTDEQMAMVDAVTTCGGSGVDSDNISF